MKTGYADLPLHYGKAPRWLFGRMVRLARPIAEIITLEYGQEEFLKRLADPYFFQAFGCVLGFDWHSSGLTTTVTGALKIALANADIGIFVAGGKGKTSKKAPKEIAEKSDVLGLSDEKIERLIKASRLSAKVDNNLLQDGYELYHHTFIFTERGKWAVIQQGMLSKTRYARRYHWLSDNVASFVEEPGQKIATIRQEERVLNLVSRESREARKISVDLAKEKPTKLVRMLGEIKKKIGKNKNGREEQKTLFSYDNSLVLPPHHEIIWHEIARIEKLNLRALEQAYERQPTDYEELLEIHGMGAKTLRALALISSLLYDAKVSWRDPARYSFAHGGKDGTPFPVDKQLYDKSIEILEQAVKDAKLGSKEKLDALKRLRWLIC